MTNNSTKLSGLYFYEVSLVHSVWLTGRDRVRGYTIYITMGYTNSCDPNIKQNVHRCVSMVDKGVTAQMFNIRSAYIYGTRLEKRDLAEQKNNKQIRKRKRKMAPRAGRVVIITREPTALMGAVCFFLFLSSFQSARCGAIEGGGSSWFASGSGRVLVSCALVTSSPTDSLGGMVRLVCAWLRGTNEGEISKGFSLSPVDKCLPTAQERTSLFSLTHPSLILKFIIRRALSHFGLYILLCFFLSFLT